ncbi:Tau-tubulin kinase 2 [Dirofilaria immitis]|nr:Tau-tubulin kinase 2 [Dirofilaria immitis]
MVDKKLSEKLPQPGELIITKKAEYEVIAETCLIQTRNNFKIIIIDPQPYSSIKLLGKGGFGAVYEVKRLSDAAVFAMKCELMDVRKRVLLMDCTVLRGAQSLGSKHFCEIIDRGKQPDRFRFIIMKLVDFDYRSCYIYIIIHVLKAYSSRNSNKAIQVGRNLWDLRIERPEQRFTLNTALKAAEQCLESIEHLHTVGFLHRDIKPGNFAIGRPEANEHHTIFMLDFGLCRQFSSGSKDLRLPRVSAPFRGTTRYASIAALRQMEQSRKDDVESWLYITVEWTAGSLPWRKLKGPDKEEVLQWKEEVREAADDPLDWDPNHKYHGPTINLNERQSKHAKDRRRLTTARTQRSS